MRALCTLAALALMVTVRSATVTTSAIAAQAPAAAADEVLVPAEQASKLSSALLALTFLVAAEMLDSVGPIHEVLRRQSPQIAPQFRYVGRNPDGSQKTVVFETFEEFDHFVGEIRHRFEAFKTEILRRGFSKLDSNYEAKVGRGCAPEWLGTGHVTVESKDFTFALRQEQKQFSGATVKEAGGIIFPGAFKPPLVGRVGPGRIDLKDTKGKCAMSLVPSRAA